MDQNIFHNQNNLASNPPPPDFWIKTHSKTDFNL